jgi:nitroreductase/Pyruvate/2-oxoacid:ferredoxin oxidoreductase delta subunit
MVEITHNAEICKKCGLCAMTCPMAILQQEEKGTIPKIVDANLKRCMRCGQCVAICPQGALSHSRYPEGTVNPIRSEHIPTYDQVLELVRSRRAKRLFKDTPVEREVIEKVLDAARFGPSGHNHQTTEFVVIQDKEIVHEIGRLTAEGLLNLAQPFRSAIGRMVMRFVVGRRAAEALAEFAPELEGLASLFNSGTDWLVREAPVMILFCADSANGFSSENANLAVQNATLAAEALGLGCFYTGFVVMASRRSDSIAKLVSLPETHKVYGSLAMGYPRLRFTKWPERNQAKVTWVGFD